MASARNLPPLGLRPVNQIREICERSHQRQWKPIPRWFSDAHLVLHIVREMRQRISLLQAPLSSNCFIAAGERDWLKRKERNLFGIIQRESDNRTNLIVVDSVNQGRDQNDLDTSLVQVIDRAQLHIEEISYLSVTVSVVTDAVELEIHVAQASLGGLVAKLLALRKLNPICCRLYRVIANLARISNSFDEVRRDCRLAP